MDCVGAPAAAFNGTSDIELSYWEFDDSQTSGNTTTAFAKALETLGSGKNGYGPKNGNITNIV